MIEITRRCRDKLVLLAERARKKKHSEISGLAWVEHIDNRKARVYDAEPLVHKQYSSAEAELDPSEINKFTTECYMQQEAAVKARDAGNPHNELHIRRYDDLRGWWHSHPPSGPAGFSSIDDKTISELSFLKNDWVAGILVVDKAVKGQLQIYHPFQLFLEMKPLPIVGDGTFICEMCDQPKTNLSKDTDALKMCEECAAAVLTPLDAKMDELLPESASYGYGHGKTLFDSFRHSTPTWGLCKTKACPRVAQVETYAGDQWCLVCASDQGLSPFLIKHRRSDPVKTNGEERTESGVSKLWNYYCVKGDCKREPKVITDVGSQFCNICAAELKLKPEHILYQRGDSVITPGPVVASSGRKSRHK